MEVYNENPKKARLKELVNKIREKLQLSHIIVVFLFGTLLGVAYEVSVMDRAKSPFTKRDQSGDAASISNLPKSQKPFGWHDTTSYYDPARGGWKLKDLFSQNAIDHFLGNIGGDSRFPGKKAVVDEPDSCRAIVGWACDPDDFNKKVAIHFFKGDKNGPKGEKIYQYMADQYRKDVKGWPSISKSCGDNYHGFVIPIPDSFKTGTDQYVWVYAIDYVPPGKSWSDNPPLGGTGIKINCRSPKNKRPYGYHDPTSRREARGSWTLKDLFSEKDINNAFGDNSRPTKEKDSCQVAVGWACDPDDFNKQIKVRFYGEKNKYLGSTTAKYYRKDVKGFGSVSSVCGGSNKHGFIFPIPDSLKTGKTEYIQAYADNYSLPGAPWTGNFWLGSWARTIKCDPSAKPIYRFLNKTNKDYFYTKSVAERKKLMSSKSWKYEGVAFYANAVHSEGTEPIYRFFNKKTKKHLYTKSAAEKKKLMANKAWKYEGVVFYTYKANKAKTKELKPVYRFLNKSSKDYFYTDNTMLRNKMVSKAFSKVWKYEGIPFYGRK